MKNIFRKESLFQRINKEGYFVIDLLDEKDIQNLKSIYKKYSLEIPNRFFSSSFISDEIIRKNISQELQSLIRPKINLLLKKHKELGAVFLVKPTGPDTQMPIHQDWTVVDEPEHHSFTAWIPLQDTIVRNGAITVLPKSHKLSTGLRSPSLIDPLGDIKDIAAPMMQTLEMKAGQAFIFSHALLHASHPNTSEENRIAVAYGIIHQETDLIYYHKPTQDSGVQKLSIPQDFFISYPEPGKPPANSNLIEELDYKEKKVSIEEFKRFYGLKGASFWEKIKSIWNK